LAWILAGLVVGAHLYLSILFASHAVISFDEGYNLQVPINLLKFGIYGSNTLKGFRILDPFISAGPLLTLPITLMYRIFGVGIVQARLVSIIFGLAILITIFLLNKHLVGVWSGLLSILLVLISVDTFSILVRVLGEGVCAFLLLLGFLFWGLQIQTENNYWGNLAGLAWGFSIWSKPSMIIPVGIIVMIILAIHLMERGSNTFSARPNLFIALFLGSVWFIVPYLIPEAKGLLPFRGNQTNVLILQQFDWHITDNFLRNIRIIIPTTALPIFAACAVNVMIFKRGNYSPIVLCMSLLFIVWFLWWLFLNNTGWIRHVYPGLIVGIVPVSYFLTSQSDKKLDVGIKLVISAGLLFAANSYFTRYLNWLVNEREPNRIELETQMDLANRIESLPSKARILGWGWNRAWDIASFSDRPFGDLIDYDIVPKKKDYYLIITPTIYAYPRDILNVNKILELCSKHIEFESGYYKLILIEPLCPIQNIRSDVPPE
jgi:hypothetical protein